MAQPAGWLGGWIGEWLPRGSGGRAGGRAGAQADRRAGGRAGRRAGGQAGWWRLAAARTWACWLLGQQHRRCRKLAGGRNRQLHDQLGQQVRSPEAAPLIQGEGWRWLAAAPATAAATVAAAAAALHWPRGQVVLNQPCKHGVAHFHAGNCGLHAQKGGY